MSPRTRRDQRPAYRLPEPALAERRVHGPDADKSRVTALASSDRRGARHLVTGRRARPRCPDRGAPTEVPDTSLPDTLLPPRYRPASPTEVPDTSLPGISGQRPRDRRVQACEAVPRRFPQPSRPSRWRITASAATPAVSVRSTRG